MRRALALALALPTLLAAEVATGVLAPGAVTVGVAQAADSTGKIKTIRIRKRRAGASFKVVVVSEVGGDDAATSATVTVTDPGTGAVLAESSGTTTRTSRKGKRSEPVTVQGEGINSEHDGGTSGSRTLLLGEGGLEAVLDVDMHLSGGLGFDPVDLQPDADGDSPWVEVAHDSGFKARLRMRGFAVGAQVRSEDGTWLPLDAHTMAVALSDGTTRLAVDLADPVVQQRFVLDIGDLGGATGPVLLSASVDVGDGSQLQVGVDGLSLPTSLGSMQATDLTPLPGSAATADQIQRVRLAETNRGGTRLVVFTTTGDAAGSAIEGQVIDPATGACALDTLDESPAKRVRLLENGALDFDADGEVDDLPPQLGGSTYLMLADMYDSGGDIVGNQQEFEVSVDGVEARTGSWQDGQTIGTFTSTDGLFEGNLVWQAGTGVGVAYAGTEPVAAVDLTFEEPFDGPVPLETTVTLPFVLEADKWVTRTRDPVPAGATVGVTLVDAEGGVLDAISATNASTGRVYENTATEKSGDILIDGVPLIFD